MDEGRELAYKKNPSVVCTELDGGAILLDLNTKYYYNLNETGLRVWRLLDEVSNISEISQEILAEYDIDKDRAEQSVREIMTAMNNEGLVIAK